MTMSVILPVGIVIAGLTMTGATLSTTAALVNLGGENLWLVLLIGVMITYLMGMIGLGAYLFLAITLAPAVVHISGFSPIAVHLFILYYSMLAFITPPVALGSFLAAAMSGANPMKTAFTSMRLGVVIYFIPFFFLFNPALVLSGPSVLETLYLFVLCLVGIAFVAAGMEGYLLRIGKLKMWPRPLLVVGGCLIAYPGWIPTLVGAALVAAVIAVLFTTKRMAGMEPVSSG